jgi:Lipocalin-like domain
MPSAGITLKQTDILFLGGTSSICAVRPQGACARKHSNPGRSIMRLGTLTVTTMSALLLAVVLPGGDAIGQQKSLKEQLVGAWSLASYEATNPDGSKATLFVGNNPQGIVVFDAGGRFAYQVGVELPKFAANDRMKATPDEARAVMQGMIAYYGSYSVNEAEKTITLQIERTTFPNQARSGKRVITSLTADELKYSNPARTAGGQIHMAWKRAK